MTGTMTSASRAVISFESVSFPWRLSIVVM